MKQQISAWLRKNGLINTADYLRFLWKAYKNSRKNTRYIKKNPYAKIPPDRLMYEIFGDVHYFHYFRSGRKAAESIKFLAEPLINLQASKILEWGCGTSRILHNFNDLLGSSADIYGADINSEMIEWSRDYHRAIKYSVNRLIPPLDYQSDFFDLVYSASVFTHLSEDYQIKWLAEIKRVLKSGGIYIFTVHGDYYANKLLSEEELAEYNKGKLVTRMNTDEVSRTTSIFQSADYMRSELLRDWEIVAHYPKHEFEIAGSQDIWIIRK